MQKTVLTIVGVVASVLLTTPAESQSNHPRDRKIRDYFGRKNEFRQPRSEPRHRHPTSLARFRTISGEFNNLDRISLGTVGVNLRRMSPADYADGFNIPAGQNRKSAREISNIVLAQSESVPNEYGLSAMLWQWGQFLDHDLDLTESADPPEPFFIDVPVGDPFFDPFNTGNQQIMLFRSIYRERRLRQQLNEITSWIDGSNVYGSDDETALELRELSGGLMKVSTGNLLPVDEEGFFLAGDIRSNEQIGLTSMHTLFVREHNRIATRISERKSHLSDEQIYLRARKKVISIMQAITYNEFLPALLGADAIEPYRGYNPAVNPNIANEFSTAAYRFGHTMLNSELLRLNNDGEVIPEGNIALRDAFFNPDEIKNNGIDSVIKGLTVQVAQRVDAKLIDDVRNFLFGPPGNGGFDLASLNIQRGRDHGLPDLNTVRISYGLPPHNDFDDINSDPEVQLALQEAYEDIDDIDLWIGCLAESHVIGSTLGQTAHTILKQQFENLRDGDRFWYLRDLNRKELKSVEKSTLRRVISRNTTVRRLQDNVFFVPN